MNGRVIGGTMEKRGSANKTRVLGVILVILGLAAGCSDKAHVPSGVLPREKMEDVLWDMIQADQYSSFLTKDSAHVDIKLERLRLYEQVFLLHGVSRDQFRKSYDYYMAHPDLAQTLFDSLNSKGTRLRSEAYSRPSVNPLVGTPAPSPAPSPVRSPTLSPVRSPALSPVRSPTLSPARDTTHKIPVHPSRTPVFDRPGSRPGHPALNQGTIRPVQ